MFSLIEFMDIKNDLDIITSSPAVTSSVQFTRSCRLTCKGGPANNAPKSCHKEPAKVMIMNILYFMNIIINKQVFSVSMSCRLQR